MPTVDRHLVRRIFSEALELAPADRVDFIKKSSAGDVLVRDRVLSLLSALKDAGDFLGSPTESGPSPPPFDPKADTVARAMPFEGPGVRIGNYKLLQLIGEGGFGSVFMAEQQQPVVRRVALKIIKLGMDTRQVIARFEAERQALAMMDHPNIARVLDAGATETGRPYFVMELVRGEPITDYCDSHNLTMSQRLELFMKVCKAVQHAHHKGIIHRDLKPSNVLVALHDGVPVPKVIDFGIAKATSARLTEKTLFTEFRQFIGTPEYMSPEQAGVSSLDVDTRSDVYSLGVLLYELLTGTTPFDAKQLRSAAFDEIKRIIREVDPPKPSTRVSTLGKTANTIAAHRHTEPRKLSQFIRGDLDWIVMRCLEKDRTRRYETANDLARDIQRYMDDEPVDATPPGMVYRTRKFLRRHRTTVLVGVLLAASLILGLVATSVGLVTAKRERNAAQEARRDEEAARIIAVDERQRADDKAEQFRQELYISQINRAQHLIDTGGSEPVKPILAACDSGLRCWEWNRLNWLADRSERTVKVHDRFNNASHGTISYSRDGTVFFTIGDENCVRIWDAESFQLIREIVTPVGNEVSCAAFSPDGSLLAVGTGQHWVRVFRVSNGELWRAIKTDHYFVRAVAISPDNARLATGTWFESTVVWELSTGDRAFELTGDLGRGEALHFSKDGSRLLIGSLGNNVAMIDMSSGRPLFTERGAGFVVEDAALSPDETKIASIGQDSRLWIRDANNGRLICSVATGKGAIYALAFHPDVDFLAVVGSDGLITFFDSTNGENLGSFGGHEARLVGVTFHSGGKWMLSMDTRGMVKRWHLGARQALAMHRTQTTINCAQFSADNSLIYFGPTEHGLSVFDASTMQVREEELGPIGVIADLRISADGSRIFAFGDPLQHLGHRLATLYDRNGRSLASWRCDKGIAGFSADSGSVASLDDSGVLVIRHAMSGEIQRQLSVPNECTARMQFIDDDSLACAGADGSVRVIDIRKGAILRDLKVHEGAFGLLTIDPKHQLMVTSAGDNVLNLWNWTSGQLRHRIVDAGDPTSVAISPDGRRLIAGGGALSVLLWDTQTGRRLMTIGKTTGGIGTVAFSPDGHTIITAAGDHAIRMWETQMPSITNLDKRYEADIERRKVRREMLEYGREWRQ